MLFFWSKDSRYSGQPSILLVGIILGHLLLKGSLTRPFLFVGDKMWRSISNVEIILSNYEVSYCWSETHIVARWNQLQVDDHLLLDRRHLSLVRRVQFTGRQLSNHPLFGRWHLMLFGAVNAPFLLIGEIAQLVGDHLLLGRHHIFYNLRYP